MKGKKYFFSVFPSSVNDVTCDGNRDPFLPLIKAGEIMHVGKGTSFGVMSKVL